MPQMMPMHWLWLFCLCFLLIILTMNFIYFHPPVMFINNKPTTKINLTVKKIKWNWNWS